MYNRYIPQPDGSHQRNQMPEPAPPHKPTPAAAPESVEIPVCVQPKHSHPSQSAHQQNGILNFFKQLLPRNMDTGDLMVILLLLLIAGDCEENKNNALLTLALYFFL